MVESIRATTPLDDQLAVAILEEVAPGCTQAGLRTSAQQRAYVHLRLSDLERAIAAGQYQEARVALRDLQVQAQDHESAVVDLRQRSEARR